MVQASIIRVRNAIDSPASVRPTQSQRDCATKPRVARNELRWVTFERRTNPEGVAAVRRSSAHNPFGVDDLVCALSQGSSFLATLGFVAQSLLDSLFAARVRIRISFLVKTPFASPSSRRSD